MESWLVLTGETPALQRLTVGRVPFRSAVYSAFLLGKQPPAPRVPPRRPEWRAILAAAQYACDVLRAVAAGETARAWSYAALASSWLAEAQGLLYPAAMKRLAELQAEKDRAERRRNGTIMTCSRRDERKQRARERYCELLASGPNPETGDKWTMDDAAITIRTEWLAAGLKISVSTIRRKYLAGCVRLNSLQP
jgi:hypothetical protein